MKRFRFRLENVLRLRKRREETATREFSKKKAELLSLEADIEALEEKRRRFIQRGARIGGIFTAFEIVAVDNYMYRIENSLKRIKALRKEKLEELGVYLERLKEAKKAVKVLENLKQRQKDRYNEEVKKEERDELDDINQRLELNRERLTIKERALEDL